MAALCGLQEPYSFAAGEACGIGGVPKAEREPWLLEPDQGTGRTTRIILLALLAVEAGHRVRFTASTLRNSRWVTERAREYATKAKLQAVQGVGLRCGPRDMWDWILPAVSIRMLEQVERGNCGSVLTFRDHSYLQTLVRP